MNEKFYSLNPTFKNKWFWGQVDLDPFGKLYMKGMEGFKGVVKVEIDAGIIAGDFLWNSHNLIVVSRKVINIWKKFDTKFEIYEVKIVNKELPEKYYGVAITGRGGPLDKKKSRAKIKYGLKPNGKPSIMGIDGMYFFEDKWDGSDLFKLDEFPLGILVTERVMEAMKKANITNCRYTPVEDVRF